MSKAGRQQQTKRRAQPKRQQQPKQTGRVKGPAVAKKAGTDATKIARPAASRKRPSTTARTAKPAASTARKTAAKARPAAPTKVGQAAAKVRKAAAKVSKDAAKATKAAVKTAKPKAAPAKSKSGAVRTRVTKPEVKAARKTAPRKKAAATAKPAVAKKPTQPARKPASAATRRPAAAQAVPARRKPAGSAKQLVTESKTKLTESKKTAETAAKQRAAKPVKAVPKTHEFKLGEQIVYPAHGVGEIVRLEDQEVAGIKLELYVISFLKDKMTLRVPVGKATSVGMRKLADAATVGKALETVRGRARVKRTMWSRRAQEYEAKINSGDLIAIAEVVRDLYRSDTQPEQSYSERQLYEAALDRMAREIAAVERLSETEAVTRIEQNLAKSPRRGVRPGGADVPAEQAA